MMIPEKTFAGLSAMTEAKLLQLEENLYFLNFVKKIV